MNENKEYTISFTGLAVGKHHFKFEVKQAFFAGFENSEISNSAITVDVALIKQVNMLELGLSISGNLTVDCDRCGDDLLIECAISRKLIVKFAEEDEFNDDDIICLSPSEHQVNLHYPIYETIASSLPLKKTHEEGKCNPEVLRKLKELTAKTESVDPRWDALKNIDINLN